MTNRRKGVLHVRVDVVALALDAERRQPFEVDALARLLVRLLVAQHGHVLAFRLHLGGGHHEARAQVHHVADHRVLAALLVAHDAGVHVARRDPDARGHARPEQQRRRLGRGGRPAARALRVRRRLGARVDVVGHVLLDEVEAQQALVHRHRAPHGQQRVVLVRERVPAALEKIQRDR